MAARLIFYPVTMDGSAQGILFEGGAIWTGDPGRPRAEALAVERGWIVAVGETADLRDAFPRFARVSLDGCAVLPAFTDSHIHFAAFGLALRQVELRACRSLQDAVDAVALAARAAQRGEWIRGRGWDKNLWPEGRFPRKDDLDPVTGDHPALLLSKDGHVAWVNSLALTRAGITRVTPDPAGGTIVRDAATGDPTGLLAERAVHPLSGLAGRPSPQALEAAIQDATAAAHQAGIAGVHVMEGGDVLSAFQRLRAQNALGVRVCMMIPEDALEAAIALGIRSGLGDAALRMGGVKIFADGALGPQTASLLEPYEGQPENSGVVVRTRAQLRALVHRAASHGVAAVVHAIGDQANRWVLDAFEAVRPETIRWGLRHRIEHVQLLHPQDLPRLAALDVIASMQPIHCTQDRDIADRYWGNRSRYAYAFRSLVRCGTRLTFGSDAPVETLDVLAGIYAAVTRKRRDEPHRPAWYAEESLTVEEAVRAYTEGAAYAAGEETIKGRLARGYVADFVALSEDPFAVPPDRLPSICVMLTVVDGAIRYSASSGTRVPSASSSEVSASSPSGSSSMAGSNSSGN